VTPREYALKVKLPYCDKSCAGDALLCVPHAAIARVVAEAMEDATKEAMKWTV